MPSRIMVLDTLPTKQVDMMKSDLAKNEGELRLFLEEVRQAVMECLEKRREHLGPDKLSKEGGREYESDRIFPSQR